MKVSRLLESRRGNWLELERLCERHASTKTKGYASDYARFAALYRSVCADIALAESHQLPRNTTAYLHKLAGRAHNILYRNRKFDLAKWMDVIFREVPQRIFSDRCVQTAFLVFWGLFTLSLYLAYDGARFPDFAEKVLGKEGINTLETNFKDTPNRSIDDNLSMAGFYIINNTGIGLSCFAWGTLLLPGLFTLAANAVQLGAAFGYMTRPDVAAGENFYHFVTAHGPFELTAIVLSAGAGFKIGMSWIAPGRLTRGDALRQGGSEALPIMAAAVVMFFLAALIEGFISPVDMIPYWVKAGVSAISSALLVFYFVVLGFPKDDDHAI